MHASFFSAAALLCALPTMDGNVLLGEDNTTWLLDKIGLLRDGSSLLPSHHGSCRSPVSTDCFLIFLRLFLPNLSHGHSVSVWFRFVTC